MTIQDQINAYIASQPEPKRRDMQELHAMIVGVRQGCRLWFLDGRNEKGRVVSNPNIGYGSRTMNYADGTNREFYRIGLSANTTGISVYIMGIDDKKYLGENFGTSLGKATVTGYCIRFKALSDIDSKILRSAIEFGFELR